jgi:hypothetical protein
MMVTFGVHIREQGCTTKEGDLNNKESKINSVILRQTWMKRGELPQGAKSLHMGGLVLP